MQWSVLGGFDQKQRRGGEEVNGVNVEWSGLDRFWRRRVNVDR